MPESDNMRSHLERIRLHTRAGSEAERAALPRSTEMPRIVHEHGTTAFLVFENRYGRNKERGQVRTVVLADNGNEWLVTSETIVAGLTPEVLEEAYWAAAPTRTRADIDKDLVRVENKARLNRREIRRLQEDNERLDTERLAIIEELNASLPHVRRAS